jgi:hypothetical protein
MCEKLGLSALLCMLNAKFSKRLNLEKLSRTEIESRKLAEKQNDKQ